MLQLFSLFMQISGNIAIGDYVGEYELSGKCDENNFYFIRIVSSATMPVAHLIRCFSCLMFL